MWGREEEIVTLCYGSDQQSKAIGHSRDSYSYHKLTLEVKLVKRQELESCAVCKAHKSPVKLK